MVQQIKKLWTSGREDTKKLNDGRIKGMLNLRAFLYSLLIAFVIAAPIILVFINLFSLYAPGSAMFLVLAVTAGIIMLLFNGVASVFYVILLRQYFKEVRELSQIRLKAIFFVECFNLPVILLVIGFVVYFSLT
jgi:hypothetical protein